MRLSTILISILLLCTGCNSIRPSANMASWEGSHIDEVTSAWGAPNRCGAEQGQKVCAWSIPESITADPNPLEFGIEGNRVLPRPSCLRTLAFDQSDHVTGWRWRGDRCGSSTILARTQ